MDDGQYGTDKNVQSIPTCVLFDGNSYMSTKEFDLLAIQRAGKF